MFAFLRQKSETSHHYITRWPRVVARLTDLFWQLALAGPPVYLALIAAGIHFDNPLIFWPVVFICSLPFALLIDSFIGGLLGNTPAKMLVGLRVRNSSGGKPELSDFIRRNYGVWTEGLSLGLLPITIFSGLRQFKQISGRRSATYDEVLHIQVLSLPSSGMRAGLLVLFIFLSPLAILLTNIVAVPANESMVATATVAGDNSATLQSSIQRIDTTVVEGRVIDTTSTDLVSTIAEPESVFAAIKTATPSASTTIAKVTSKNEKVLTATAGTQTVEKLSEIDVKKADELRASVAESSPLIETNDLSAKPATSLNDSIEFWINPVSGYATPISREFSILTGQTNQKLLATFRHRSGNSTISFEQHIAEQAIDENRVRTFLLSQYDTFDIDGGWNSHQLGDQTIHQTQGKSQGSADRVSIQAAYAAGKIYVLLIQGNYLDSDFAKYDQLTAAVWNSI